MGVVFAKTKAKTLAKTSRDPETRGMSQQSSEHAEAARDREENRPSAGTARDRGENRPNTGTARERGENRPSWRDVLNSVAEMDLWETDRREDRTKWKGYLRRAEELLALPRTPLPQDVVEAALRGDFDAVDCNKLPSMKKKIVVFVSSTFTDTKAERNTLMKDVNPYLRSLCRILGLDFGCVDMRWGVNEETTLSHATSAVCTDEVDRCVRESGGPAFLAILGHKYGYQPFPPEIICEEFDKLRDHLMTLGEDVSLLDEYYRVDENMLSPHYVLKSRDPDQKDWWDVFSELQAILRQAAQACLKEEDAEKYFISVTEQEMQHGIFRNDERASQVTMMRKTLANVRDTANLHRHIIDMVSGQIDEESQRSLEQLKEKKINDSLSQDTILDFTYEEAEEKKVVDYVRMSCDAICESLVESILKNYESNLHKVEDDTFSEIVQHAGLAKEKSDVFVGREHLIEEITSRVGSGINKKPLVVYGPSGCGKTALMAICAKKTKTSKQISVAILRFLGTTGTSSAARSLLHSLCVQMSRAYDQDHSKVPTSYKDLVPYFKECLGLSTERRPMYLFLDSLDQLSNEDFGKNLKWLSLKDDLPDHTYIIVSTLPGQCLDTLRGFLPSDNFVGVEQLRIEDGPLILGSMLKMSKRTLTTKQTEIVLNAFAGCPMPLYMRLAVDIALRWHSYDTISGDVLATDMPGLVNTLFERLESKYGKKLVHHALSYITVAKFGLSAAELEDILSCDNEVLDDIFQYWVPPFIRMPPLLWIRIRNELGPYLVERGSDGVNVYGWYHRQFWETAKNRFVWQSPSSDGSFHIDARRAVSDYFEGKWFKGKHFTRKKGNKQDTTVETRQVASQPLIVTGSRQVGRIINRRKLSELPHQLLKLQDWENFKDIVGSLDFIEAKFEAGQGYECVAEFAEASHISNDDILKALAKFIGANVSHMVREPESIYQLASQQASGNPVHLLYEKHEDNTRSRTIVCDENPSSIEDPCQLTLRGHTSGVRSCCFSSTGDLIASCAEDGSLRIWDAFSGAEVVAVRGLPGPTYPELADPYHGERPCCFSPDSRHVATGSEDGTLQVWDIAGAQVHETTSHQAAITGLVYSNNGQLASCSKDQTTKIWTFDDKDMTQVASIEMRMKGLGCDVSPDGTKLAVGCYGGLVIISLAHYSVLSSSQGYTNLNLGVCFSPTGHHVATGGDNSGITLWDANTGQAQNLMTGHSGWVWCVKYTSDGSKMISCSSDRTIKMWNMLDHTCIASLGGHLHRVSWTSIKPATGDTFVTGSLDFSLKIWDLQAVASGVVPPVGGLHFTLLRVAPDRRHVATCQGWSTSCSVTEAVSGQGVASTTAHGGFLGDAAFLLDSSALVTIDTGHRGDYSANSVYGAEVYVTGIPSGHTLAKLPVTAPIVVACSRTAIFIGTMDGKVSAFSTDGYQNIMSWDCDDGESAMASEDSWVKSITARTHDHVAVLVGSRIKVWDVSNLDSGISAIAELSASSHEEMSVCLYSADGEVLTSADMNGSIDVWQAGNTYNIIRCLSGHAGMLRHVAFSPGGRFLASVGVDMCVKVWDSDGDFIVKCAWYGPVNQLGFMEENKLVLAEATGNRRVVSF